MFLIIGQGNPGLQYVRTKHNVGFWVLDRLSPSFRQKGNALLASISVGGIEEESQQGWAMKPMTFYNGTGEALAPLVRFYKIPPERILVIHDELDLPPGKLRFKAGGSNAGNNGLNSISSALGTQNFHRLRIGIGKPPSPDEGAHWVLTGFHPDLLPVMDKVIQTATEAVQTWVLQGIEACQKKYNSVDFTPKPEAPSVERLTPND